MNDMPIPVPVLAGLVGFPRSGKDTLGDMLEETGRWKKVAFADALKDLYLTARPCRWWELDDEDDEEGYFLPIHGRAALEAAKVDDAQTRHALQRFGHTARQIDPDFWVLAAARTVAAHMADGYNVVLTDIRYANEFEYVKRKGLVFGVHRHSAGPVNGHQSEQNTADLLDQTDFTLLNVEGDAEQMRHQFEVYSGRFFGGAV